MAAAAFWAVTGHVASTVAAPGILTHAQGSYVLQSPVAGQVTAVLAEEGERVAADAPLLQGPYGRRREVPRWSARSPPGRVTSLAATHRAVVTTGADVATVERAAHAGDPLMAMLYVPAAERRVGHRRGRRRGPHRPVRARPAVRRAARPGEGRRQDRADARSRSRGFLGDSQLGEQFSRDGQAGRGPGAARPSPRHEVRLPLVLRRRPAVPAHLHDAGRRIRPARRPAPGRLAAAVTARGTGVPPQRQLPQPATAGTGRPRRSRLRHRGEIREAHCRSAGRPRTVRTPTVLQMEAVECGAACARHGARPLRPARAAGGAAHRLRRLPRRLTRQQPAEGGPQLRADGQGHADGAGRAGRGAGAGDPVLGVQPLRRLRRHGPPLRPARRAHQRPRQGPPFRPAWRTSTPASPASSSSSSPARTSSTGGRKPGVLRALPARLRGTAGTHARGAARQPAAGRRRRGGARAEPYVHRHVPDRRQTSLLGVLFASMGAMVVLTVGADLAAAGEPAARPHHLLHAQQRPLPAASAAAAGHLLLPAQPRRPGAAPPVQRRGRRDPGPRPGRGRAWTASSSSSTRSCCGPTTRSSPSSACGSRCSTWWRCASSSGCGPPARRSCAPTAPG